VLDEAILRPLGATSDWRWVGYDDAWVELRGRDGIVRRVRSVPGGTHWGGGVSISARDQARVAQLLLQGGRWQARTLLSKGWIDRMTTPCPIAPWYGMLVWLNGERGRVCPSAGPGSWFMIGAGGHTVWADPARQAVVVARWVKSDAVDRLIDLVVDTIDARDR
jgi:CubicO group peptidase (beta-lactamase class C family)